MELEKIISIAGKPGLFQLIAQMRSGFIIEDITTKKKTNISNTSQVSLLDNISMYTFDAEVPLFQVFKNIAEKEDYKQTISHKGSKEELREFMNLVLPNYDVERVYDSDIKKLIQWYNILQSGGFIAPDSFVTLGETEEPKAELAEVEEEADEKPAKKTTKKEAKKETKKETKKEGDK